ncbi:MAG: prepilin-type N-terminal cleavage/methylation domain-containing protein [Planctomycetota bacterium]
MGDRGFTLIELLVATSVVTVVIALALPTMSDAKTSARAVACQALLAQQGIAWSSAMVDGDGLIPRTWGLGDFNSSDKWWSQLIAGHLNAEQLRCPEVPHDADYALADSGYAVNVRWGPLSKAGDNELQQWELIASPSLYPWIGDPFYYEHHTGTYARRMFGYTPKVAGFATPGWGLGMNHQGKGQAVYADGHVEASDIADFAEINADGVPEWFFDR